MLHIVLENSSDLFLKTAFLINVPITSLLFITTLWKIKRFSSKLNHNHESTSALVTSRTTPGCQTQHFTFCTGRWWCRPDWPPARPHGLYTTGIQNVWWGPAEACDSEPGTDPASHSCKTKHNMVKFCDPTYNRPGVFNQQYKFNTHQQKPFRWNITNQRVWTHFPLRPSVNKVSGLRLSAVVPPDSCPPVVCRPVSTRCRKESHSLCTRKHTTSTRLVKCFKCLNTSHTHTHRPPAAEVHPPALSLLHD